jgi:hypothetical protein
MKDLDLKDVFCEILSGLSVLCLLLSLMDLLGYLDLEASCRFLIDHLSLSSVTAILLASYLLGIIGDTVGLSLGEWKVDSVVCRKPTPNGKQRTAFWQKAPSHVLRYRDTQWAYYACYRNLFLLTPLNALLWGICLKSRIGLATAGLIFLGVLIIEVGLFFSMRVLLGLYYEITRAY